MLNVIPSSQHAATVYFMDTGNRLTEPHSYGADPLERNALLKERRNNRFYQQFESDTAIYHAIMRKNERCFENAVHFFQNITRQLSR